MKNRNNLSLFRVLMIGSLFTMASHVNATSFAYSVDQIKIEGNLPGYVVDNFDDGILAPWSIDTGTAVESGGVVMLTNPGKVDSSLFDNYLITDEKSEISIRDPRSNIADGAGDFVVTSTWLPFVPTQNQMYAMQADIEKPLGVDFEIISLGIVNVGSLLADVLGSSTGLNIIFEHSTESADVTNFQLFPIAEGDITGTILFSLLFEDSADLFTGSFSLDGGMTYYTPFYPVSSHIREGEFADWELYATSIEVQILPEPSTFLLFATGLAGLSFCGMKKAKV
jgi:hypothetical protein